MLFDQLQKSPQVRAALSALTIERRAAINMLFLNVFLNPFEKMASCLLEESVINGERFEILRGKFFGGEIIMLFYPNDGMHIASLLPNLYELDYFITTHGHHLPM